MDFADLTAVDVLLAIALVYAVWRGAAQGALSQVAAFGGAALGLLLGAWGAPGVARALVEGPGPSAALLIAAVLLVCLLVGQTVGVVIGGSLRRVVHDAGAGWVDRLGGVVVGVAGLVLLTWLLAGALVQGPFPRLAQQVGDSVAIGVVDDALPPPPDVVGRLAGYLDDQGFPQVVAGLRGGITAEPVEPTSDEAVQAAAAAAQPGTVQIAATGCGGVSTGSGFVTEPGFVVTNAHVVAGNDDVSVRDAEAERSAVPVWFDADLDVAVLRAPDVAAEAIEWADDPADRGVEGATLGFPGGRRDMVVKPATVAGRGSAVGRDIYGEGSVEREVLTLSAEVRRGDSGGPFVTAAGQVAGVVFAANAARPGTGYALTAEQVRDDVATAVAENTQRDTGRCRF